MKPYQPVDKRILKQLQSILGAHNVSTDEEKRLTYSKDEEGDLEITQLPDVVVFPEHTDHVSAVIRLANTERIPVTARGAGTGLSGGAVPLFGGIVMSMEKMNQILDLDLGNLTITVEPGVVTDEIQKLAASHGLLYGGDPCSSDASFIGGNVAENAGGNKVIKYGPTGAHVMGLEVVLADGSVTMFGGKHVKDVTGLDFVHLMVGSEGILGIITKIILRLLPLPKYLVDLLVPFPTVKEAIAFVPKMIMEAKLLPVSIEFMDNPSLQLTQRFLNTKLPFDNAGAHLIIELEGSDKEILADDYERLGKLCMENGALEVFIADNRNTRLKIWKARKAIAEAISAFYPHFCMEDVVVPTSEIPKLMDRVYEISQTYRLPTINFGHAGDGNMHVTFLNPDDDTTHWNNVLKKALHDLYQTTIDLGGTLSGEHGIGMKRKPYLCMALDASQIQLIQRVKKAFDPNGILNPGKIVDCEVEVMR